VLLLSNGRGAGAGGSRLYRLNWFVCFYDCVLVPAPRAPWIAIGLTGRKGTASSKRQPKDDAPQRKMAARTAPEKLPGVL
jgi:hypothetical protein